MATLCGDLWYLTDGEPLTFRSQNGPLSLVMCSDEYMEMWGFEATATSHACPGDEIYLLFYCLLIFCLSLADTSRLGWQVTATAKASV